MKSTLLSALVTVVMVVMVVRGLEFDIQNHWDGGFNGQVLFPISQEMNGWKIHIIFDTPVLSMESSEANVLKLNDKEFVFSNKDFNAHVTGSQLNINFMGRTNGNLPLHACAYLEGTDEGVCTHPATSIVPPTSATDPGVVCYPVNHLSTYSATAPPATTTKPPQTTTALPTTARGASALASSTPTVPGVTSSATLAASTVADPTNKNYGDALHKSILFYDAQRSGKLPADNPVSWRGDSALNDCVVGGWYDAGDHVKFGLPFGATVHLLLWGMQLFKEGYVQSGQLGMAYDMIKWATDYMLHAWNPATQELVAQIGDGNADHSFWGRAEDMTMNRPCMKLGPGKPGADVAGEWAAGLAAGSIVFKDKGDTTYAAELLKASKEIYAFAKANPGTYTTSIPEGGQFYSSSGFRDEMCLGGVWLYRATREPQYLADAVANHEAGQAWALSWDDKKVACQLLLWGETSREQYREEVAGFMNDWMPGGAVPYTPCGLAWRDKWGANRYAGNAAFLALAAAAAGINPDTYRTWAVEQLNFLLGDNRHDGGCFSYEIGAGSQYPRSPHHRSASCPDMPQPCSEANLHTAGPSPQLLEGALVGGPDQSGNYRDNREDFVMNEVAIDYNSGFQSALAGVNQLLATGKLPPTNNKCPCTG